MLAKAPQSSSSPDPTAPLVERRHPSQAENEEDERIANLGAAEGTQPARILAGLPSTLPPVPTHQYLTLPPHTCAHGSSR